MEKPTEWDGNISANVRNTLEQSSQILAALPETYP